ncbi:neutral zinc metallopeptidase [Haloferula helveola]|uniref:Neutral zinc metallopeptidase n=1 Tax=Haloferula helveola TaxID=490095 RepID=A0ABN6H8M9_9BACT|nr:neutral zinc metallopeptidase [Haloferula helveola]
MNFELLLAQLQQAPQQGTPLFGIGYWILIGATMLVSMLISGTLKSRFQKYSQIPIRMTGAQVAEMMLRQNGINDVQVVSVPGQLTDHYDPRKKTVNLSEPVYHQNTVAAAAVAAHECGHALQHQQAYAWLTMRSKMVPAVQLASGLTNILMWMAILGAVAFSSQATIFIWVFLGAMGVTTLFSLVTLPVEFDASKRALAWLDRSGAVANMEHEKAKDALFWAAMTYVAAAVAAIAQLAYWAVMLLGRRD